MCIEARQFLAAGRITVTIRRYLGHRRATARCGSTLQSPGKQGRPEPHVNGGRSVRRSQSATRQVVRERSSGSSGIRLSACCSQTRTGTTRTVSEPGSRWILHARVCGPRRETPRWAWGSMPGARAPSPYRSHPRAELKLHTPEESDGSDSSAATAEPKKAPPRR